jgi:hypothetical protein
MRYATARTAIKKRLLAVERQELQRQDHTTTTTADTKRFASSASTVSGAATVRTIEQAKLWIEEQRSSLGYPRITDVRCYLNESLETVSVYAEVENQMEINGDLPLVAGFDLPLPITETQFELMREAIEKDFASA